MKKILLIVIGVLICISLSAQENDVLTNSSVIDMFAKKLPSSIILGKIKSAKNTFNVNTEDLLMLT